MASQLPRMGASQGKSSAVVRPLKRKASDDDDLDKAPAKAQAIAPFSNSIKPLPVRASARLYNKEAAQPPKTTGPSNVPKPSTSRVPLNNSNRQIKAKKTRSVSVPTKIKPVTGIVAGKRTAPDPRLLRSKGRAGGAAAKGTASLPEPANENVEETENVVSQIMDADQAKVADLESMKTKLDTDLAATKMQDQETRRGLIAAADEIDALKRKHAHELHDLEMEKQRQDRELQEIKDELLVVKEDLNREREIVSSLQDTVEQHSNAKTQLEAQNQALRAQIISLQSEGESQLDNRARLNEDLEKALKRVEEVELELRAAETLRRKLHNQLQELKGNIRVFCRVRPALAQEKDIGDGLANINFPDLSEHKEIVLSSSTETATGASRDNIMPFTFDRVFGPKSTQLDVFEEISYLAQSCIDGYNVCIFAYGQTGSGKSFTMEGGPNENDSGMIPRAVKHIFQVTQDLKRKGWEYKMEGQFLEIYNETIVDLLGKGNNTKHEIKHDKDGRTTVTNVVIFPLHSPNQVQNLLSLAQSRRTVHATLMNDRSSRSHSVFTLRITGSNVDTGEKCEGSLNLVDLAGSERLKESGALNHKDRLKETQAINKSLSALGDVIAALGDKSNNEKSHIPYRNSKLTFLLQNSLSGNSKTLMFLNLSPLAAHLNESLCSLRFATKVNTTNVGVVRKQATRNTS